MGSRRSPRPRLTLDGAKVGELIEGLDITPSDPRSRGRGSGKMTAFAIQLGRAPGTIWNIVRTPMPISRGFAVQIATALGVELGEITAAGDSKEREPPGPELAEAS